MIEVWALVVFICGQQAPACEAIERGHFKTKSECVEVLNREVAKARRIDRGSAAICYVIEERGEHT